MHKNKLIISVIGLFLLSSVVNATHLLSGGSAILWTTNQYTYHYEKVIGCDWLTNERPTDPPSGHLTISNVPSAVMSLYTQYGLKPTSYVENKLENCHFQCARLTIQNGDTIIKYSNIDSERVGTNNQIRMDSANYDPVIIGLDNCDSGLACNYNSRYGNNEDMTCRAIWHLEFYGAPVTTTSTTPTTSSSTSLTAPTLPPYITTTTLPPPPVTTLTLPTTTTSLPSCVGEQCPKNDLIILLGLLAFGGALYYMSKK